jgi:hypothetical protein
MSERLQRTSKKTGENMLNRYPDGLHHKHDKNHRAFRMHYRTHPNLNPNFLKELAADRTEVSSELLRELKMRKTRKRYDKGQIH